MSLFKIKLYCLSFPLGDKQKSVEYLTPLDLNVFLMTLQGLGVPPNTPNRAVWGRDRRAIKTAILTRGKGTGGDRLWPRGQHILLVRNSE